MRLFLLFLISIPAWAQLTVTCPKAYQGQTVTCSASGGTGPYTYSVSAGSGSINSSTGDYTAPSSVPVKQKVGPCQLLPPDHIYNTRIDALPALSNSADILANVATGIIFNASFGTNIMTNATASQTLTTLYTPSNDGSYQVLSWPWLKRESGVLTPAFGGEDRHVLAVNRETCEFSDIYNNYTAGENTSCPTCTAQSAVKYDGLEFALPTSGATDAAGMAQQPVSLRLEEIRSGEIKHALRFTLINSLIAAPANNPPYIWPATANAQLPSCAGANCFRYGMHVRLKASKDISGYSATAQVIATALKHYGMILTDGGINFDVQTNTDVALDPTVGAAFGELYGDFVAADLEVVDTSTMDISAANGAVNLSNGYVTPTEYAEVTVTDSAMATATTRVALGGVVVGVAEPPVVTIWAGHTHTFTAWVTGTATQTVTWSMSPSVGTLNSSTGEYTAPTSVTTPTSTVITATSTVDGTATATVEVVVWPDNDGGNYYVDVAGTSDTTGGGHTWWKHSHGRSETGYAYRSADPGTFPGGTLPLYNDAYKYHSDVIYKWLLPNGNYKITAYVGLGESTGALANPGFRCTYEAGGAEGQQVYRERPLGTIVTGGTYRQPGTVEMPMKVTDGTGYVALRHIYLGDYCVLNGLSVEADATTPYITIDTVGGPPAATADITISQTRQFYAVGWYMANTVNWSVVSGPGSIDANGLYTAPSTPPGSTATVTVRATSTVDGMVTADVSFDFVFGTLTVTGAASYASRGQTVQFSASIGGVAYSNVTWSRSGSQGSINSSGLYSAPGSISPDETIVITATSTDDGTKTGTANLDLQQLIAPIYLNVGATPGAQSPYTDAQGRLWTLDNGTYCTWSGANLPYSGSATFTGDAEQVNQQIVYNTERHNYPGQTLTMSCTVPNGVYAVKLKMGEYRPTSALSYMDVKLEGVTVLSNWDVVAQAGGVHIAIDRDFTVAVADGVFTMELIGKTHPDWVSGDQTGAQMNGVSLTDQGPIVGNAITTGRVTISGGVVLQ